MLKKVRFRITGKTPSGGKHILLHFTAPLVTVKGFCENIFYEGLTMHNARIITDNFSHACPARMIHTQTVSLRPRKEQSVRQTIKLSHNFHIILYQITGITYSWNICQNIYNQEKPRYT